MMLYYTNLCWGAVYDKSTKQKRKLLNAGGQVIVTDYLMLFQEEIWGYKSPIGASVGNLIEVEVAIINYVYRPTACSPRCD